MPIHKSNGISYVTSDTLENVGVPHGFFMRHGGCSPAPWQSLNMATSVGDSRENVIGNRKRLTETLEIPADSFYDVWQVHSDIVVATENSRPLEQSHIQADAITTNKAGIFLLMLFADCVPILIFDQTNDSIGIAHAGWKGTLNEVVFQLINTMKKKYGSKPQNLKAVIGPAICQDHYEVGEEIAEKAKVVFQQDSDVVKVIEGHCFLDLAHANHLKLTQSGITEVENLNICTACQNDDWFSHRGENGKTGRFAAVIGLRK